MTALQYNYSTLAASLADWPEDDDADFGLAIPNIIRMGEIKLTRDLDLEIFEVDDVTPIVSGVATIAKLANMVVARTLEYTNGGEFVQLDQRTVDYVRQYGAAKAAGNPLYYAELNETQWIVAPTPNFSSSLRVRLVRRAAGLDAASPATTSWLSVNMADLLFWSCLMEAHEYLKNDPKFKDIEAKYNRRLPAAASEVGTLRKKNAVARLTLEGLAQLNAPPAESEAQT